MDKPITVAREEFRRDLVDVINNAKLPAFVIRGVIEEILPVLKDQENMQYQKDLQNYCDQGAE